MKKGNAANKRIAQTGWMPFWYGNKFMKRLFNKRVRAKNKKEDKFYQKYDKEQQNANRCICCGEIIPEGRQVCPGCESEGE